MDKNQSSVLTQAVQRSDSILNRRSHISFDIAMKKYYSGIGSRLSDMRVPDVCSSDSDHYLSQDLCMLTIDTRRLRSRKQRTHSTNTKAGSNNDCHDENGGVEVSQLSQSSKSSDDLSTIKEREIRSRAKKSLLHKLTCSLFPRKHMCSRCKRRSKNCISSQIFSGTDKRYICCKCRDKPQTIKNIFDVQSSSKDAIRSYSTAGQLFSSLNKDRVIHISRKNINDSGYDTVTSCSTVASAHSAFSTPAIVRQNLQKNKKPITKPVLYGDQGFISEKDNSRLHFDTSSIKYEPSVDAPRVYLDQDIASETALDNDSELSHFLATIHHVSTDDELTQIKQKNVQKYEGYIPEMDNIAWGQNKARSVLSDTSNLDDSSENGDFCYFPPRIMRISPSGKNTHSSEKSCYTCDSTSKPCFRLPWEGGWVCEDCLDGLH